MASVLVIALDPHIESLFGELVAFAGHRPLYDGTAGVAGESVRRSRPDLVLVDIALPAATMRACLGAADEVGARPVLMSSAAGQTELAEHARANHCLYFALPGGPKPLSRLLDRALAEKRPPPIAGVPARPCERDSSSFHPALRAALANMARARILTIRIEEFRGENAGLRTKMRSALSDTRHSQTALRAAIADYARQLKADRMPIDAVLETVRETISDCASIVGAESSVPAVLRESEVWARESYAAA